MLFLLSLVLSLIFSSMAGQGWEPVGPDQIPIHIGHGAKEGVGRIDCIAFHPGDTSTFWVGTPTGGLWKTTNNCESCKTHTDHLTSPGIYHLKVTSEGDVLYKKVIIE